MNIDIDTLEKNGEFVQADTIRKLEAARKSKKLGKVSGDGIANDIMAKIMDDISIVLTDYGLPTAIFYVEKAAESSLATLKKVLIATIQEVVSKVTSKK